MLRSASITALRKCSGFSYAVNLLPTVAALPSRAASWAHFHSNQFYTPHAANAAQFRSFSAQPAVAEEDPPTPPPEDAAASLSSATNVQPHPGMQADAGLPQTVVTAPTHSYWLMNPAYSRAYMESVTPKHRKPEALHDWTGWAAVQVLRRSFDLVTGYSPGKMTADRWLTRFLFLETVAGVPGMVGAGLRHMRSLRTMKRDQGWIRTLLEEAENERMHLLTFMQMAQPGPFFRAAVLGSQGVFLSLYTLFYAISPKHCHSFVSYLEEEAVKTYTQAVSDIDSGRVAEWQHTPAPEVAIRYWRLEKDATMRDVLLAVRADEACHKHVNATFAGLTLSEANPFSPGTHEVP